MPVEQCPRLARKQCADSAARLFEARETGFSSTRIMSQWIGK